MIKGKQGAQVEYPAFTAKPVRPIQGMWTLDPPSELAFETSPDMQNCTVIEGFLRKRPGFTKYKSASTNLGKPIIGLYSTQNASDDTHLVALTRDGVYKWNTATDDWDAMTGPALTGNDRQPFVFETSQDAIVFTQGVDKVNRHDISVANTVYALLDANAVAARYITRFANRLILGHTSESGVTKPFRVRRSVALDHTDWTGVGSGFTDLSEFPYHVRGLRKQGATMVVYTENSIHIAIRTEVAAAPYRIDIKDTGTGLFSERSLKDLPGEDGQVFLSNDNVYLFNGVQARQVADQIRETLFGGLRSANLRQMFAELTTETREYLLFTVANSTNEFPDKIWAWNYGRNIWYPWTVRDMCSATLHRLDDSRTIDELVGTIDEQNFEFDSRTLEATYPALLTGGYDGNVYRWGFDSLSDNGAAIESFWTSRDWESDDIDPAKPLHQITLRALSVVYEDRGPDTLEFYFSTDGGDTWSAAQYLSIGSGAGGQLTATLGYQITGAKIRFKMRHYSASTTFKIARFVPVFEVREPLVV